MILLFFKKIKTCSICHYMYILVVSLYSEFKKIVPKFPEFCKLDGYEEWVENCGNRSCSHNHNIRKNATMLPWTTMDMNWCDFMEIIDCYCCERKALCSFCEKCKKCRKFKLLCTEAETITLNSWRDHYD